MSKRIIVILLSTLLFASANILEARTLRNYWGDQATDIYIGTIYPYGTYIGMRRKSDGRCMFYRIGDLPDVVGGPGGLDDNYTFYSGNGSDYIILGHPTRFCGYQMGDLPYNGHYFDIHGGGGNDYIECCGNGDSWLFGEDGDDHLKASDYPGARVYGGAGNDEIYGADPTNNEQLYGGSGNDALCDACFSDSRAGIIDGGSGTDCSPGNADDMISIESSNCGSRCYYLY